MLVIPLQAAMKKKRKEPHVGHLFGVAVKAFCEQVPIHTQHASACSYSLSFMQNT